MVTKTKRMLASKPGKENLLIKRGKPLGSVGEAMAGMKGGETRSGFLGEGNIIRKPDFTQQPDSIIDLKLKRAIQTLLLGIIEPNPLSAKSSAEMDKRSLVNKLKKSTLGDLKRLLPDRLKTMAAEELEIVEVTDEEKSEIQDLYIQLSP